MRSRELREKEGKLFFELDEKNIRHVGNDPKVQCYSIGHNVQQPTIQEAPPATCKVIRDQMNDFQKMQRKLVQVSFFIYQFLFILAY